MGNAEQGLGCNELSTTYGWDSFIVDPNPLLKKYISDGLLDIPSGYVAPILDFCISPDGQTLVFDIPPSYELKPVRALNVIEELDEDYPQLEKEHFNRLIDPDLAYGHDKDYEPIITGPKSVTVNLTEGKVEIAPSWQIPIPIFNTEPIGIDSEQFVEAVGTALQYEGTNVKPPKFDESNGAGWFAVTAAFILIIAAAGMNSLVYWSNNRPKKSAPEGGE